MERPTPLSSSNSDGDCEVIEVVDAIPVDVPILPFGRRRGFDCFICWMSFLTFDGLIKHCAMTGHKEYPYACGTCASIFYSSTDYLNHPCTGLIVEPKKTLVRKKATTTQTPSPYSCPKCGKAFRTESTYFRHLGNHKREKDKRGRT